MTPDLQQASLLNYALTRIEKAMEPDYRVKPPKHWCLVTVDEPDQNRQYQCRCTYRITPDFGDRVCVEVDLLDVVEAVVYLDKQGFTIDQSADPGKLHRYVERALAGELVDACLRDYQEQGEG